MAVLYSNGAMRCNGCPRGLACRSCNHGESPARGGAFIYRAPQEPVRHQCSPPTEIQGEPSANWHDIWKCECGALWSVYGRGGNHWVQLGRYASWRARRQAARAAA